MSMDSTELIKLANASPPGHTRELLINEVVARSAHERQVEIARLDHEREVERLANRGLVSRMYDYFFAGFTNSVVSSMKIGSVPPVPPPPVLSPCSVTDWIEDVSLSSVELLIGTTEKNFVGNGVAIAPHLILSALHGQVKLRQKIVVTDRKGVKHNGVVDFVSYEQDVKDLTVIRVDPPMDRYIAVATSRLTIGAEISIVGYKIDSRGEASLFYDTSIVKCIESEPSTLYIAGYTAYDGLSGAGVFVGRGALGDAVVVGVHVASHDNTAMPVDIDSPPVGAEVSKTSASKAAKVSTTKVTTTKGKGKGVKTAKGTPIDVDLNNWREVFASKESVRTMCESITSDLHGHMAYTLICEPIRVDEFLVYMQGQGVHLPIAPPVTSAALESKGST